MPKIANKYPHEKMPKHGLEEVYSIDRNGNFLNKKGGLINKEHNFVLTKDGKLKIGDRHHFLANAEDVVAAGNINFKNGKVVNVINLSGHYKPTEEEAFRYMEIFKNLNFPIKRASAAARIPSCGFLFYKLA